MDLPSMDQGALITVLGVIGTALAAIARGLYKILEHFLDKAKTEGLEQGKVLTKLDELEKDVFELQKDIKGIANFVGTPRAKGESSSETPK